MILVQYERLAGCLHKPSDRCYSIEYAHMLAKEAIEKGGYKEIIIFDSEKALGDIFPIERYFLTIDGWERD